MMIVFLFIYLLLLRCCLPGMTLSKKITDFYEIQENLPDQGTNSPSLPKAKGIPRI